MDNLGSDVTFLVVTVTLVTDQAECYALKLALLPMSPARGLHWSLGMEQPHFEPEPELVPYLVEAPCTRCRGAGKNVSPAFTSVDGVSYPERVSRCSCCAGSGKFPGVDIPAILAIVFTTGRKPRFRASWPAKLNAWRNLGNAGASRAYYVWRLARFHGGADVTMPMTAMTAITGDPHLELLDAIAEYLAQHVFGTDKAAAYRWANALGHSIPVPSNQPASAFEGGPVVTEGEKPDFEREELK